MALFLSESVQTTTKVSLHEAMSDVMEVVAEGAELGEAILRADYILHVQSQTLQEAEMVDKAKGFLRSAYEKVKAFILKLIAKVKQFVYALVQRIKGWFGKAEIRDDQFYKVNKEAIARAEAYANKLAGVSTQVGSMSNATEIESELANLKKEHSQELAGKASDTPAVVKGSVIRKVMKEVEGAISKIQSVESALTKAVAEAEKAVTDADKVKGKDGKEQQEAASKALELARAKAKYVTSGLIPGANAAYAKLLAVRPTLTKQEAQK